MNHVRPDVLGSIQQEFWKSEELSIEDINSIKRRFDTLFQNQKKDGVVDYYRHYFKNCVNDKNRGLRPVMVGRKFLPTMTGH